ncbi:MAG: hypothetical protein ACOCVC_02590 [Spirochaeta sp.]
MNKSLFNLITMLILCIGGTYAVLYLNDIELLFHAEIPDIVSIAADLQIRNLVTVIYLGPRVFDTLLEVMVVLLTVYGIKYIHSNRESL